MNIIKYFFVFILEFLKKIEKSILVQTKWVEGQEKVFLKCPKLNGTFPRSQFLNLLC